MINRYMVILENGDIHFVKQWVEAGEEVVEVVAEFKQATQTELDFAKEAQARLDNMFPDWAGVLTWEMITAEDLAY